MSRGYQNESLLKIVLVIIAVILLLPLLMMAFAMPMMSMMGWWGGGGPGGGFAPMWGIGMMVLFLAVLIGIGYFLYRSLIGQQITRDPAFEELRLAYARGELSDEEYEQRRERLDRDRE